MKKLLSLLLLMMVMSMTVLQSRAEVYLIADGYKLVKLQLKTGTYSAKNTQYYGLRGISGGYYTLVNSGSITYSEAEKTLTLSSASLSATIMVVNQPLTIKVNGWNKITKPGLENLNTFKGIIASNTSKNELAIEGIHADKLYSTDSLIISCDKKNIISQGVAVTNTTLNIRGCSLKAQGTSGIVATGSSDMIVDHANVKATGESSTYGGVTGFTSLTLKNSQLDNSNGEEIVTDNGKAGVYITEGGTRTQASEVNITMTQPQLTEKSYLYFCGKTIDLYTTKTYRVDEGSGLMDYDAPTQTLTLREVNYTDNTISAYIREVPLTIDIIGNNNISGARCMEISNSQMNVTITSTYGDGYLNLKSSDDFPGLVLDSTSLTIRNCHVTIAGRKGIQGVVHDNVPTSDLNIDHAYVTAAGRYDVNGDNYTLAASVNGLRSINLNKTSLYYLDTYIANDNKGIYGVYVNDNGNKHLMASEVVFSQGSVCVGRTPLKTGTYTSATLEGLTKGTITYDEESNEITLDNIDLSNAMIFNNMAMNVCLKGKNTITPNDGAALYLNNNIQQPVNIYSQFVTSGSLTLNSPDYVAMYTNRTPVNISTCKLNVNGKYGINAKEATYTINRATVKVTGTTCSISGVSDLQYDGCSITPTDAHIVNIDGISKLCDTDNKVITGLVTIEPETYGISVAGVQVTPDNCDDVLGDGMVEYNPETKTLTLWDGAVLNNPASSTETVPSVIHANQDLTIALGGTVAVNQAYGDIRSTAIYLEGNHNYAITHTATVKNPVMNVKSTGIGIYVDSNSRLDISYCTVNVKNIDGKTGLRFGIAGSEKSTLDIANATVNVYCSSNLIANFASVSLKNVHTHGEGETYDTTKMNFVDANGTAVTTSLLISPDEYAFSVGGIYVTALNSDDVLGDGKVQYIVESNTLMLSGANIVATDKVNGLFINQDLNIFISGTNHITSKTNGIYVARGYNVTITGSQTNGNELYVTSTDDTGIISYGNLVVDHSIMSVTGTSGIQGKSAGTLNVYETTLTVQSTAAYSGVPVNGFEQQNLTDESIVQPANCRWATTAGDGYCVVDADYHAVRGTVVFYQSSKAVDINRLAHIIGVLNGTQTETPADDVNGDGVVDLNDINAAKDEILSSSNVGEATAEWVQLWAGGAKWATKNVGATTNSIIGNKYYYGQTAAETLHTGTEDIQGTDYDTAKDTWGDQWQMPTQQDYQQLINCCTRQWTSQSGVWGYLFRGKGRYADCTVFFPAAGHSSKEVGVKGYYWSSTPKTGNPRSAYPMVFDSDNITVDTAYTRSGAFSVRPIYKP